MRRQQYGYCFQMGIGHFMLTLTPSDTYNGIVAIIASGDAASPFQSKKGDSLMMDLSERDLSLIEGRVQELAGKDPAACAQYFIEVAEYVLTEILGFDSKKHVSKPGLLGEIEWFGGGIENQGSQLLHGHFVGRLRRWPSWLDDMRVEDDSAMCDDTSPREYPDNLQPAQVKALTDFGCLATYPVFELFKTERNPNEENSSDILCPHCGKFPLIITPLTLFHKSNKVEQQPFVAKCITCGDFTSSALRDTCLRQIASMLGEFNPWAEADTTFISPCASFPVPSAKDNESYLQIAKEDIRKHIVANPSLL
jgi:hypothetical protein